ncbi:MAG: metal ABC transporter ATP-binding protein [Candidatus Micrarchaeota archaeon]|nr:metal ABC transporter ATP-binding protein [Candidatus Micrarchaeota archaeon]
MNNKNYELIFENVWFYYGNYAVLENISFRVKKGEFLAILGHNGAGKTTLMKLALGILKPSKGKITWLFHDSETVEPQKKEETKVNNICKKISYVQQNLSEIEFSFPANVEEVVLLGTFNNSLNQKRLLDNLFYSKEHRNSVDKVLKLLKIENLRKKLIGELSTGQLQKVFLAKALVSEPEVLFLDEPTSAMDLQSQIEFYSLLKKLNEQQKITIILISHDIGQILNYVTRVIVLNKKIVFEGNTNEFDANSFFKLTEKI